MLETIADHWLLMVFWLSANVFVSYGVSFMAYRRFKKKDALALPRIEYKPVVPQPTEQKASLKALNVSVMKKEPR